MMARLSSSSPGGALRGEPLLTVTRAASRLQENRAPAGWVCIACVCVCVCVCVRTYVRARARVWLRSCERALVRVPVEEVAPRAPRGFPNFLLEAFPSEEPQDDEDQLTAHCSLLSALITEFCSSLL